MPDRRGGASRRAFAYTYDLAGNRTSVQLNSGTPTATTYNKANQITNAGFSYDNAGNLINDGTAAYTYDALNRTTIPGSSTFAYNGDGTLVSQLTGGVTTRYTQDLAAPLTQVLQTQVGSAAIIFLAGRFALVPPTRPLRGALLACDRWALRPRTPD